MISDAPNSDEEALENIRCILEKIDGRISDAKMRTALLAVRYLERSHRYRDTLKYIERFKIEVASFFHELHFEDRNPREPLLVKRYSEVLKEFGELCHVLRGE